MTSIQKAAAPGGVANLLSFLFLSVPAGDEDHRPSLVAPQERAFWQRLVGSEAEAAWPAIAGGKVRLGQVMGGCFFAIEDEHGVLVIGGVGTDGPAMPWIKLLQTVREIRSAGRDAVERAEGGLAVLASWEEQTAPAPAGPWLAVVPMMGLRYYTPDADRILQLAGLLGADLLAICNRSSLFPRDVVQQDI